MPTPVHTIKQTDTLPVVRATLTGTNGSPPDLTGATVTFSARQNAATLIVDHGACVIDDPIAATVHYQPVAGDTMTPGSFPAEFEVTFSDGRKQTFPNDSNFVFKVIPHVA